MFFIHHDDGRCSLVNGFSGAATPLRELAGALLASCKVKAFDDKLERKLYPDMQIKKVVMSSASAAPSSPNHQHPLVAVLVSDSCLSRVLISTCRPAGEINSCVVTRAILLIVDIAFFQGKLYAHLRSFEELVAVDLGSGCLDKPTPLGVKHEVNLTSWIWPPGLPDQVQDLLGIYSNNSLRDIHDRYLVESDGKLLMVRRRVPGRHRHLTSRFEVFEAVLNDGPRRGRWKKAESLDGRALFVSTPCSKSVRASDGYGARADCIYFVLNYGDPLLDSGVYNVVDKTIMPLMPPVPASRRAKLTWVRQGSPAWFFPVQI
jgi:hypothetical protein